MKPTADGGAFPISAVEPASFSPPTQGQTWWIGLDACRSRTPLNSPRTSVSLLYFMQSYSSVYPVLTFFLLVFSVCPYLLSVSQSLHPPLLAQILSFHLAASIFLACRRAPLYSFPPFSLLWPLSPPTSTTHSTLMSIFMT